MMAAACMYNKWREEGVKGGGGILVQIIYTHIPSERIAPRMIALRVIVTVPAITMLRRYLETYSSLANFIVTF